jgi:hypothetical protein
MRPGDCCSTKCQLPLYSALPQRRTVPDGRVSGARKLARTATVRTCISPQVPDITGAGCTPRHFARFLETAGEFIS